MSAVINSATLTAANFPGATETVTIASYPVAGTAIVVTRAPGGTISTSGASHSTQKCVKLTLQVSWTGVGNKTRTRQVATLLAKGGL